MARSSTLAAQIHPDARTQAAAALERLRDRLSATVPHLLGVSSQEIALFVPDDEDAPAEDDYLGSISLHWRSDEESVPTLRLSVRGRRVPIDCDRTLVEVKAVCCHAEAEAIVPAGEIDRHGALLLREVAEAAVDRWRRLADIYASTCGPLAVAFDLAAYE